MGCTKCKFRGWHINPRTRQREPCPHCQPKAGSTIEQAVEIIKNVAEKCNVTESESRATLKELSTPKTGTDKKSKRSKKTNGVDEEKGVNEDESTDN